jgi:hypothetical protein
MSEIKIEQAKAKAYLFEITSLVKNDDGTIGTERKTLFKGYTLDGGKVDEAILDCGDYWKYDPDGCLNLVTEDGRFIDTSVDCCLENAYAHGFRGYPLAEKLDELCDTRRWFELRLGDVCDTTLRVTLLDEIPRISRENTIKASELGVMGLHCVKLYGRPLFEDGDTVGGKDTSASTCVLRTALKQELNAMWESHIKQKSGVTVSVKLIDDQSADSTLRHLVIVAKTRADMDAALSAIGVNNPGDVEPNVVFGNGGADSAPAAYEVRVILTDNIQ